jgi:hypothetical protein
MYKRSKNVKFTFLPFYEREYNLDLCLKTLNGSDVVIAKTGWQGIEFQTRYNKHILKMLRKGMLPFVEIGSHVIFPDDSRLMIFAKKSILLDKHRK